jgi:galactose mutarotase-like enzyme
MFKITTDQQQYLTYHLADTKQSNQLSVIPERGGIVTQWAVNGRELLYLDTDRLKDPKMSVRGGIPVLFPICGNLPQDTYKLGDKEYTLVQHGFARSMPWQVVAQQTNDHQASLTVALASNSDTKLVYPFDFKVELEYLLSDRCLTIRQRVTNLTVGQTMPFALGYHPYFTVEDKEALQFQIPSDQCATKDGSLSPFPGHFDFGSGEIDLSFNPLTKSQAQVTDPKGTLSLSWDSPGGHLVFWTLPGQDFYCLEPWSSGRNAMNTGKDMISLASGETWSHDVKLAIS